MIYLILVLQIVFTKAYHDIFKKLYYRYRGRMLSYNEFLPKNTAVELIDSGSIVKKCLCDLYKLPDCFKYDPLVSITFLITIKM